MSKLKEFRAQFPQYNDLDDQTLADSLHKTHYADIPRRDFDIQIGLRQVSTALHGRRPAPVEQPSARPIDDKPAALAAAEIARGPQTDLDPVSRTRERMASVAPQGRAIAGLSMQRSQQEHMRRLKREGSWGEVLTDTSVQIGAKMRSARGTVEEMAGKSLRGGANLDIRRAELLPFVVEDAKRLGIEPKDHPLVKREAKALKVEPQVFAEPALNPYYLNTYVKRLDKYRERAESGGRMAARGGAIRQEAAGVAQAYRPRVEEWTAKDIISSIGQSAPELLVAAAGGAAGGVPAGLAAMGVSVFPQFYAEALNEGRDEDTAGRYAALMTVAEVLPEAPLLNIISKAGGKKALSRALMQGVQSKLGTVAQATVAEGASEMLTEAFQMGIRLGMFDEQVTVKEAFNRLAKAGVIGSAMGSSLGAVIAGGQTVGEKLARPSAAPQAEVEEEAAPSTKDIMIQAAMKPPKTQPKRHEEVLKELQADEAAVPELEGERDVLMALKENQATPEQAARAVSLGYAALNENNEPIMLPRARRRLRALEEAAVAPEVLPGVQPVEGQEAVPGVPGAGEAQGAEVAGVPAQAPSVARGEVERPLESEADEVPGVAPAARAEPGEGGGLPQEAPVQAGEAVRGTVAGTAVEVAAEPTEAQKEAGNYKKGRVRFKGLDISIENLKGQTREGKDARGRRWSSQMRAHYGYVRGTESKDGDPVDVFLGEDVGSGMAYVIDQLTKDGKNFDEHKVMLGFESEGAAETNYREHYPKNWKGMGAITAIPIDQFKDWLNKGDTTKPMRWGSGFEPPRRSMRRPQPEHDTILEYISKLRLGGKSSGANFDELVSEGLDPADLKSARGHGINRPFTRNGATLDQLAEALFEAGYPVTGPDGRYDKNVLLDRITEELRGRPARSTMAEGFDTRMAKLVDQYEAQLEQEARSRPDETTEQRIQRLTAELNTLENERDAREEQEARALAEAGPSGPTDEPMFHRKKPPTDEQTGDLFAANEQEAKAVALRNQIKKLELERDRKRNEGQVSADIGMPGDLFSEGAQRQMDITDVPKEAVPSKPAEERGKNQIGDVTAPAGMGPHTHELMFGHTTSEDAGHRHKWKEDGAETTSDHEHTHGLTAKRPAPRDPRIAELKAGFISKSDEFWGVEEDIDSGGAVFTDDGQSAVTCTGYACAVERKMPNRTKVMGFLAKDNQKARTARDADGHDFAVVDGRFIVDPWVVDIEGLDAEGVYDLEDVRDNAIVEELYGDRKTWEPLARDAPVKEKDRDLDTDAGRTLTLRIKKGEGVPEAEIQTAKDTQGRWTYRVGAMTPQQGFGYPFRTKDRYETEREAIAAAASIIRKQMTRLADSDGAGSVTARKIIEWADQQAPREMTDEADRNSFTVERLKDEKLEEILFQRGEFVRGSMPSGQSTTGEITGISHARQEARVGTQWFDFGQVYKAEQPTPKKATGVPLAEAVEAVNKRQPELGLADKIMALTDVDAIMERARSGTLSLEDYKAAWQAVSKSQTPLKAELEKLTKDQLLERMGSMGGYRYRGETKARVVNATLEDLFGDFALSRGVSFTLGSNVPNAYRNAVGAMVEKTTEADLAEFAQKVTKARAERAERIDQAKAALADPQTNEQFAFFIRVRGEKALTMEQRDRYDALQAEDSLKRLADMKAARERDRATVKAAGQTVGSQIIETKHTKKGHDLFVVQLEERVERDVYEQLNTAAKQLGGYYSSYRGGGAIPGFTFTERDKAEAFVKLTSTGDTAAATEVAKERRDAFKDDRTQSSVERLTEMADRLEERAQESLGQERLTNTMRRAEMAGRAEAQARQDIALAKTMRNIAQAIESGEAKFLAGVRTRAQVEMLSNYLNRARHDEAIAKAKAESKSDYVSEDERLKALAAAPTAATARFLEFPVYRAYRSDIAALGRELSEIEGAKQVGERILKLADDMTEDYVKFVRENLAAMSLTTSAGRPAVFGTREDAERARKYSPGAQKLATVTIGRGKHYVVMSPAQAIERNIWKGPADERITLPAETGAEATAKALDAGRRGRRLSMPWVFEGAREERMRLQSMGVETSPMLREAMREFIRIRSEAGQADPVQKMMRALIGQTIGIDFFPTPPDVAASIVAQADIVEGQDVLEPSAGYGAIADAIKAAGVEPDVVELSSRLRDILTAKGYELVGADFMDYRPEKRYDRIVMNPPFSNGMDIDHVRHAYELLKEGGRIVSIMGGGSFFRSDKKATEFRDWLDGLNGTSERLPPGTFLDKSLPATTGVNARVVVIEKPTSAMRVEEERSPYYQPTEPQQLPVSRERAVFETRMAKLIQETIALSDLLRAERDRQVEHAKLSDFDLARIAKVPERFRQHERQKIMKQRGVEPSADEFKQQVEIAHLSDRLAHYRARRDQLIAANASWIYLARDPQGYIDRIYRRAEESYGKLGQLLQFQLRVREEQMGLPFLRKSEIELARNAEMGGAEVILHPVRAFASNVKRVRSAEDVAQIVRDMVREPQEVFLLLVTDRDGKPLAALEHTLGGTSDTSVYPSIMVGAIATIPNARKVYMIHNHPTGDPQQSTADNMILRRLGTLLEGSGLELQGSIVVAGEKYSWATEASFPGDATPEALLGPESAERAEQLQVFRRRYAEAPRPHAGPQLRLPEHTEHYARTVFKDSGLLLLNHQHRIIGELKVPIEDMAKLRTGDPLTGTARILAELHRLNVMTSIVTTGSNASEEAFRAAINLMSMLTEAGVRVLDVLQGGKSTAGQAFKWSAAGPFLHAKLKPLGYEVERVARRATEPARSARAVAQVIHATMRGWTARPNVRVVQNFGLLPSDVRTRLRMSGGRPGEVDMFFDPPTATLYAIAEDLDSDTDITGLVLHEAVVHFGIRQFMPENQYDEIMDGIFRDLEAEVRQKAKDYFLDLNDAIERRSAAEEVVATMAETYLNGHSLPARMKRWFDRIIAAILEGLARLGIRDRRYDKRFIAGLLTDLHEFVQTGESRLTKKHGALRHQSEPVYYSEMFRQINDEKFPHHAPLDEMRKAVKALATNGKIRQEELDDSLLMEFLAEPTWGEVYKTVGYEGTLRASPPPELANELRHWQQTRIASNVGALQTEFNEWLERKQKYPHWSAEEVLRHPNLTKEDRDYVEDYIRRWDSVSYQFESESLKKPVEKISKSLLLDYLTSAGVSIQVLTPNDPELAEQIANSLNFGPENELVEDDPSLFVEQARASVDDKDVMQRALEILIDEDVREFVFALREIVDEAPIEQSLEDGQAAVSEWDYVTDDAKNKLARERHYEEAFEQVLESHASELASEEIPRTRRVGTVEGRARHNISIEGSVEEGWTAYVDDDGVAFNEPTEEKAEKAIVDYIVKLEEELGQGSRYLQEGFTIDPITDIENYFERVFSASRIPGEEAYAGRTHWDEPNVVAHVRGMRLNTPDGKPVLFADELQSDWAATYRPREEEEALERVRAQFRQWNESGRQRLAGEMRESLSVILDGTAQSSSGHHIDVVPEEGIQQLVVEANEWLRRGELYVPDLRGYQRGQIRDKYTGDPQDAIPQFEWLVKLLSVVVKADQKYIERAIVDPDNDGRQTPPLLDFVRSMKNVPFELPKVLSYQYAITEMGAAQAGIRHAGTNITKPPVSKTWQLMILKWLIRHAIDTDASVVAIAPGSVHSVRYGAMDRPPEVSITILSAEKAADILAKAANVIADPDLGIPGPTSFNNPQKHAKELLEWARKEKPNVRFVAVTALAGAQAPGLEYHPFITTFERLPGFIGQEAVAVAERKLVERPDAEEVTVNKREAFLVMPPIGSIQARGYGGMEYKIREHYGHMVSYNQVLPAMFNRWLKKFGVKLKPIEIEWSPADSERMATTDAPEFYGLSTSQWTRRTIKRVEAEGRIVERDIAVPAGFYALGFELNDALREQAKKGFPLYHRKSLLGLFRRRQAVRTGTFDMTEGSKSSRIWNALVFKIQDRLYDLFRLQEEAKKFHQLSALPDALDAYLKETLFHGRVEDRVEEYEKNYVVPLVDKIRSSGYVWPDVEDYLYARHAPEANLRLASINPGQPNINSGMTDVEAAQVQQDLAQRGDIRKLQDIGQHVDTMTKWYRQMIVAEGLEDPAVIQEWESTYDFYVPLKGWAHNPELGELPARGRGFDTGGKMHKERLGRSSRAANILANIVAQAQMGIIRAEKARVGRALLEFVKANPAPRLYEANQVEYTRYLDRQSGLVQKGINPTFKLADNVIRVRVAGRDEHITFNPIDPQMVRLARTMKNLSAAEMNALLTFLHGINRYLSMVNTSLNIEFVISNAFRDLQTAMVNIEATDVRRLRAKVLGNWRAAWNGIRRGELGKAGVWEAEWLRFKRAGGKVGWIQNYKSITDVEDKLRQELNRHGVIGHLGKGLEYAKEWIERQNLAVENAIRLSTFKAATDAGLSEERAAQIAKNLTVNFNKRGDLGVVLNSIYLFFNAAVQGTAILLRTAKSPRARRIMYGIVALGITRDIINRMVGGEDDDGEDRWDKIEEYKKERNMIFMLPPEARFTLWSDDEMDHVMIPMPYGYNWFDYLGQKLGGAIDYYGIGNKRRFEPTKDALRLVSSFLGAFNPVGWESSWETTVAPTILDPAIQLSQNKKWDGRPIMPPQPQYDIPDPDSQRFFKTSSHEARALTSWLNEVTGGTDVTPGGIDISPETVEHWKDFAFGGAGRFVSNAINTTHDIIVAPEDLELFEVPMLRRLIGQTGERQLSERFFERAEQVAYVNKEREALREMRRSGDAVTREEYLARELYITRQYPVASQLVQEAKRAEMQLRALRRQRKLLQEGRGSMLESKRTERVRALNDRIQAVMRRFNKDWNEAEDAVRSPTETRDLTSQIAPLVEGKHRSEQIRSLRGAGYPALADLVASVPRQVRPAVREVLEKEARS